MTEVQSITSAGRSHTAQLHDRTRNYLITMGIRVVAFGAMFFTDGWVRWACGAFAIFAPMVAVIFANSGTERRSVPATYLDDHALPAAPADRPRDEV